ncbi:MAG: FAD-binding oxidoreductase [Deltaproteobacteria bacterium]|nr:FAD-binding oxidoreductase [Deltaproteobacteria bacterium]
MSRLDAIAARTVGWEAPGVHLERCLEPETVEELGQIVSTASRARTGLLIIGGGTRLAWANVSEPIVTGLSTLGLRGVDVFEPDEGVLHARAGTPIAEVQALVREEGWELPLDAPGMGSTVGGVIASAAAGPRAQSFGRVADAVLGLEVVGADGVATKTGGRVVKNVTGYDLAKLYCGSFGSLGVLTGAWLRLRPVPLVKLALAAPLPNDRSGGWKACRGLARLTSVRASVWVEGAGGDDDPAVYFELGGSQAEVAHDRAALVERIAVREIELERIDALRDARAALGSASVVLRARVLGTDCESIVRRYREAGLAVAVDLGLGVVHARGTLPNRDALLELRAAAVETGGLATFEAVPDSWRDGLDIFGVTPATQSLMGELKRKFDPLGILNPGRLMMGT